MRVLRAACTSLAMAWLSLAQAAAPTPEEALAVLGVGSKQLAELPRGKPLGYALDEGSADELAVGVVWFVPLPVAEVAKPLRQDNPDLLDVDVTAYGLLTPHGGASALAKIHLDQEEAQAMLEAGPGDEFNFSTPEYDSLKQLAHSLKHNPRKPLLETVAEHYREILFKRFEAYRHGGTGSIAVYARKDSLDSKPSLELRQSADKTPLLSRHWPELQHAWINYPKPLPPGVSESFPWVEKEVEGRPAVILRHRLGADWNGGYLTVTREYYATHSYNSSQWLTGCLPYRSGTIVFQQVRSYTDQVAGVGSDVKHLVGRELLEGKMVKAFERLCGVLGRCQ